MEAYVKGFAQFPSSAGWIFINANLQLFKIELFEHPALGPSLVFQAEVILFETTCRKPPSGGLFIHNIIPISVFEAETIGTVRVKVLFKLYPGSAGTREPIPPEQLLPESWVKKYGLGGGNALKQDLEVTLILGIDKLKRDHRASDLDANMKSPTKKTSPKSKSKSSEEKIKEDKKERVNEPKIVDDGNAKDSAPISPPMPPKPSLLSNIKRQIYYPYINKATMKHTEPLWSPTYPLCTSWGEIWVSQRPYRKIQRYKYDLDLNQLLPQGDPIVTKGEPKIMVEIPQTGRIAVMLNCPTAKCNIIAFYNPETYEIEHKVEYPYNAQDPSNIPSVVDSETMKPLQRSFNLEDESTPYGICANNSTICITSYPLLKMQLLDCIDYKPQNFHLKSYCSGKKSCIHLASSGGCAMSDSMLFIAATRPNRIEAFNLRYHRVRSYVNFIEIIRYASFGLDRFTYGEPFGIQIDSLGLLVSNDGSAGIFHVFNINQRPKGPCQPSLPNAETCYMGSWKIDPYQCVRSGYFSLAKNGIAAIVDRNKNNLHIIAERDILKCYMDALSFELDSAVNLLTVEVPQELPCECALEETWEPIPPEQLLPESWVKKYGLGDGNMLKQEEETSKAKVTKIANAEKANKKSSSGSKSSSRSKGGKK
ncbi:hypothetical protein ACTXT7_009606 [Hymenolepis weldensis]